MKGVVNHRSALCQRTIVRHGVCQSGALGLGCKRDDAGGPAHRGRTRCCLKGVGVHHAHAGHLFDMCVRVHAAGHDVFACGINRGFGRPQVSANGCDGFTAHAQIPGHDPRRRHDPAPCDEQIKWVGHGGGSLRGLWAMLPAKPQPSQALYAPFSPVTCFFLNPLTEARPIICAPIGEVSIKNRMVATTRAVTSVSAR